MIAIVPLIGLILGLVIGLLWNVTIPAQVAAYFGVGILAAMDAIIGATYANLRGRFNTRLFMSGYLINTFIALVLTVLGEQLALPLSYVPLFAFGNRIFMNVSKIRRMLLIRYDERKARMLAVKAPSEKKKRDDISDASSREAKK